MSFRELVHNPIFKVDGTNYDVWKIRMLNLLRDINPNVKRIVDMGFSSPMNRTTKVWFTFHYRKDRKSVV